MKEKLDLTEQYSVDKLFELTGDKFELIKGYKNSFQICKNGNIEEPIFVTFVRGAISVFLAGILYGVNKYKEAE